MIKKNFEFCFYISGFIDVLGQKELLRTIREFPDTPEKEQQAKRVLRETVGFLDRLRDDIRNFAAKVAMPSDRPELPETVKKLRSEVAAEVSISHFSDFVHLYFPLRSDGHSCKALTAVYSILGATGTHFLMCLASEKALRGAIDVGMAADAWDGEIYGPVTDSVYTLESKIAQYPRIVIGEKLIDFLQGQVEVEGKSEYSRYARHMAGKCLSMISTDFDGVPFIDYLGKGFQSCIGGETIGSPEKRNTLNDLTRLAQVFVEKEHARFVSEKHHKLSMRYGLLRKYFLAHKRMA